MSEICRCTGNYCSCGYAARVQSMTSPARVQSMTASNKKEEMVTIEVPLEHVKHVAKYGDPGSQDRNEVWIAACKAALDARKSKYERWREELDTDGKFWDEHLLRERFVVGPKTARLMAAAPQLLEALINISRSGRWTLSANEAIKVALPDDVAEEVISG